MIAVFVNSMADTATFAPLFKDIEGISLDHDSSIYNQFGGDYINILKWLEEEEHKTNKNIG